MKSSFPVEIMNEIFRSSEIDRFTLARCCLLSRKYLKTARKWLYNNVHIRLPGKSINGLDGKVSVQEYSQSAARLLSTIQSKPFLGNLIRSISFGEYGGKGSGIRTEVGDAIATFISIASKIESLDLTFREEWVNSALRQVDTEKFNRFHEVKIRHLNDLSSDFISQLRHLRQLSIEWMPDHLHQPTLSTRTLHTLRISILPERFNLKNFLTPLAPTLRDVQLPVEALLELPYTDFPQLKRLEMLMDSNFDEDLLDEVPGMFWRLFDHCSKLSTLAFYITYPISTISESRIFGTDGGLGTYTPRTIRRIEFTNQISIDRILSFLYRGFVKELAVGPDSISDNCLKMIKFMCEDARVELVLLAQ